ncbi:hypothetical protein [Nocardia asiatica]|uniref:hypothetical protein n=1 Tax=Nocardia asiatica TaxID=209252 RepID=UPI003EDEC935
MNELTTPVSSVALRSYLANHGWRLDGVWRGSSVWSRNRARLLVPENAEYADYGELLLVAVSKLAHAENRTTRDVVLDISEPNDDKPSFHLHPDTASGTIPLPLALKSMQGIRDLFKVSAQTVELGAKLHYTGRSSKYVDQFLQRVRIGATRGVASSRVVYQRLRRECLSVS